MQTTAPRRVPEAHLHPGHGSTLVRFHPPDCRCHHCVAVVPLVRNCARAEASLGQLAHAHDVWDILTSSSVGSPAGQSIGGVGRLKNFSEKVTPESQEGEDVAPPAEWPLRGASRLLEFSASYG